MIAHDRPNLDVRSGNAAGAGSGRVATSADGPSAGGGAPEVMSHLRGRDSHHSVSLVGGQLRSRTTELPESLRRDSRKCISTSQHRLPSHVQRHTARRVPTGFWLDGPSARLSPGMMLPIKPEYAYELRNSGQSLEHPERCGCKCRRAAYLSGCRGAVSRGTGDRGHQRPFRVPMPSDPSDLLRPWLPRLLDAAITSSTSRT